MTVEENRGDCENFPVGLRVLAVDDDPICLKLLETLLRRCHYHVTTTSQARMALKMLRENKGRFDLVISDVHMPDMDGFKLLELVGLEMDLPVIMLSANGDPKLVMKGVTHGACDYLVKPVRIEELRNIFQHVIRKKKIDPKKQNKCSDEGKGRQQSGEDGEGSPLSGINTDHNVKFNRKRKDEEDETDDNGNESEDPSSQKKPRVVWSIDLHRKFVAAVNQLGIEKAVPKRILDLMNVEGLTRENVASHLQKYRLYLKRISSVATQQANMAAALGVKDSSFMHMGSLDGLGDFRTRLSNVTLSPFTANGMLSRLNSPSNVNLRNLNPSPLVQPSQNQNLTNSLTSLGKMHLVLPSASQNVNLFPSSLELDQLQQNKGTPNFSTIDNSRMFTNATTFSDLGTSIGSSRNLLNNSVPQGLNGGGFVNQPAAHDMTSFTSESLNAGLLDPGKCNENWQNTIDSSKMPTNPLLSPEPFHSQLPIDNNGPYFRNNPIDLSSGMVSLVSSEQRQNYAHGSNNGNFGLLNGIVSPLDQRMDMFVNGRLNVSGSTLLQQHENENSILRRSNEDLLVEQPKLQGGFVRQSFDSLDELMSAMIKREQDVDTIPNCDFGGLDEYSFGPGI